MKRVMLVTTSYPQHGEGAAAAGMFVRDFARALSGLGIAVEVVAPAEETGQTESGGVTETRYAVPRLPLSLLNPLCASHWPAIFSTLAQGQKAVSKACERHRPDHILALWALPCGAWAMRAARHFGIGYSTWALGSDIWSLGRIPLLRQYLGSVMRHAAHRFADGIQLSADVESICGRPCDFLASSRSFGPPAARALGSVPPYRLAFLGRWHPNKGIDLLLESLAMLDDQDWARIEAVRIYGGGPLEGVVDTRGQALRAAKRPVETGGYLDIAGARALFAWSDYILLPSRVESIPVVFSDAMQARRPVIATPVGDLPQLVQDTGAGLLAGAVNAEAFALSIRQALGTDADKFATGIAVAASQFDVEASARSFLRAIQQSG